MFTKLVICVNINSQKQKSFGKIPKKEEYHEEKINRSVTLSSYGGFSSTCNRK